MEPFCVLGVTGHRQLPDADLALLRRRLRGLLVVAADPMRPSWLATSLAEGADRLVAELALEMGYALYCPLPFAQEEYEKDFETPESVASFRSTLARAARIETIPVASGTKRVDGYTAAGRAMLDASRILLALWDGLASRGEGGTGQMVVEAIARRMPVLRVTTSAPHEVLIHTPRDARWRVASADQLRDWLREWRHDEERGRAATDS